MLTINSVGRALSVPYNRVCGALALAVPTASDGENDDLTVQEPQILIRVFTRPRIMPMHTPKKSCGRLIIWILGCLLLSLAIWTCLYIAAATSPESRLARARKLSTHPDQALALVRTCLLATKGDFPAAQVFECQLLLKLNRGEEASSLFKQIRNPNACDPDELCQLGELAQPAGELELASHAFLAAGNEFVCRTPQRLKRWIFSLYSQPNNEESEELILKLCNEYAILQPDDSFPWLVSASLYNEQNIQNLASEAYREALKRQLPPEDAFRSRFHLIQLSMVLGNLPLAREHCNVLLATSMSQESKQNVSVLHADLLQREGKPAAAVVQLDALLKAKPEWTRALTLRGQCKYDLKDLEGAIQDLSEAVRRDEFDPRTHYVLGQVFLQQKDLLRAKQHLNRSRELNDLIAQIFTLESQVHNDLHNRELKLQLASLNDQRGDHEKAAAWRRGAEKR
jgi:Tfp pilus assembly protein PilF